VTRILYVCTANICRSAYAEVRTRALGIDGIDAASAGTHGWVDHPMEDHMATEAVRRGVDPSAFRSRRLTRAIIDDADVVLTATAAHRTFVLEERPVAVKRTFSLGQLAAALDDVPEHVAGVELLAAGRRIRATAVADDDVSDPYGRGAQAAAEAARHLDALLERVLPRLAGIEV
jgi:protein-tyrosine-phosphatase